MFIEVKKTNGCTFVPNLKFLIQQNLLKFWLKKNFLYKIYGIPGYAGRRDGGVNLVIETTIKLFDTLILIMSKKNW